MIGVRIATLEDDPEARVGVTVVVQTPILTRLPNWPR